MLDAPRKRRSPRERQSFQELNLSHRRWCPGCVPGSSSARPTIGSWFRPVPFLSLSPTGIQRRSTHQSSNSSRPSHAVPLFGQCPVSGKKPRNPGAFARTFPGGDRRSSKLGRLCAPSRPQSPVAFLECPVRILFLPPTQGPDETEQTDTRTIEYKREFEEVRFELLDARLEFWAGINLKELKPKVLQDVAEPKTATPPVPTSRPGQ